MRKTSLVFLFFVMCLFADKAYALPQDWPCFPIEVYKQSVLSDDGDSFEYHYQGETGGFVLDIDLEGSHTYPTLFANCGTAGCFGNITEKETSRTELLRFFCEEYSDDYTKVKCVVGFGDEVIFDEENEGQYVLRYCSDDMRKTLKFNKSDCEQCHCKMSWYEGDVKKEPGDLMMACEFVQKKAHCFTSDDYTEQPDLNRSMEDFENCVGLGI